MLSVKRSHFRRVSNGFSLKSVIQAVHWTTGMEHWTTGMPNGVIDTVFSQLHVLY